MRDGGCRFPGCSQDGYVDGHHRVHEGGCGPGAVPRASSCSPTPAGAVIAAAPDPEPAVELDVEAVNKRLGVVISSGTGASLWCGERLGVGLAWMR